MIPRRVLILFVLLGLCLVLALAFPALFTDNLVTPLALVLWLVWRLLQGVHQNVWWALLILLALGAVLYRLYRLVERAPSAARAPARDANVTLERIDYWQMSIRLTRPDRETADLLKQDLGKMLATLYASRQTDAVHYEIYDALKLREIPLPEPVHAFLFGHSPPVGRRSAGQALRSIWQAVARWARRRTGSDVAEYYRSLDTVIDFMESTMEASHGDQHDNARRR